ncbi:MAG: class I SAM-dependent methyltransferase [Chloroflexota bacterium]
MTSKTSQPSTPTPTLEYVPCDLCGAIDPSPYLTVRDRIYETPSETPGDFQLVKCGYCGLLYINPRPDRASIGAYYPDLDYHAFRPASGLKEAVLKRLREQEASALLEKLPPKPRVLEIGCATGDLLVRLRSRGADVMGIEPNAAAVKVARETNGLHVEIGMLDDIKLEPGQFDLVLMKYALEHVHSPLATVAAIKKLLKPGGQAVFWVPNAKSWDARLFGVYWRGLDAPRHLYIFTPDTMRRLCEVAGLKMTLVAYSPVPNDWAGSTEFWLKAKGVPRSIARWFGVDSPLALAAWLPISTIAALARASGRIRVVATRV